MVNKVKERIIQLYDKRVLTPYMGKGEFRKKLIDGLEAVLDESLLTQKEEIVSEPPTLDEPIDYKALYENAKTQGLVVRLKYFLKKSNVNTYRDLINFSNKMLEEECYTIGGVRDPFRGRNIGPRTLSLLYRHLNSRGIKLFDDDYRSKELGI